MDILSYEEIKEMLREARDGLEKAVLETLYATGMKPAELIELSISDFDFPGEQVEVGERIIPLSLSALEAIQEYICFHRKPEMGKLFPKSMTIQQVEAIIAECASKAGIKEKVTPETIRKTTAMHLLVNGADRKSVQEFLGE